VQEPAGGRRLSPAVIWGGFGLLVVIVVLGVVFAVNGGSEATSAAIPTAPPSVQPVSADTSGSYTQLVQRANGLYDQGAAAFESEQWDQGAAYFAAAAKVYAAAWAKQSTDPGVGTDYATSLFYSGDVEAAVSQVEGVLAGSPEFQTAWFNKGNYLVERARHAEREGDTKAATAAYRDARGAFAKAVSLGPGTASGQQAQQRLDELPQ
jgi:tetratricopeptide (TPR) repeat protein